MKPIAALVAVHPRILCFHFFFTHCTVVFAKWLTYIATRVSNRNNILKALADTTWRQQKETILMTYKAIGRSVANYGAPVWSTNASATSIGKIQIAQNEALRIATGSHKMSSIDHLHNETEMLTVKQHSDLLSAQYVVQCLDPDHVCHNITTMDDPPRQMKHTLHTRQYPTVQPLLAAIKKEALQPVTRAINSLTESCATDLHQSAQRKTHLGDHKEQLCLNNCTIKMLTIYSPHTSEVLPPSLTMTITMIFDITSYDFPWQNGSTLYSALGTNF